MKFFEEIWIEIFCMQRKLNYFGIKKNFHFQFRPLCKNIMLALKSWLCIFAQVWLEVSYFCFIWDNQLLQLNMAKDAKYLLWGKITFISDFMRSLLNGLEAIQVFLWILTTQRTERHLPMCEKRKPKLLSPSKSQKVNKTNFNVLPIPYTTSTL